MTVVREALAYRDPAVVVETLERGDVLPVQAATSDGCLACDHWRNPLDGWPCDLGNMPSPRTGCCVCFEDRLP